MFRFIRICWMAIGTLLAAQASANPVLLRDINTTFERPATGVQTNPGATALDFAPAAMGGVLYFNGTDLLRGSELWRSDGTAAGTRIVKEISPASSAFPSTLTVAGSTLYFFGGDNFDAPTLWRTDGTEAGTTPVFTFPDTATPQSLRVAGGLLFFVITDRAGGVPRSSLWRSDGTAAGTFAVHQMPFFFAAPTVSGSRLFFFSVSQPANLVELWSSDGSVAGTQPVRQLTSSTLVDVNGIVFSASNDISGTELWKSDGTAAGTVMVKDINPGFGSSSPSRMTKVGSRLFFFANDGVNGVELWSSDGTSAGTALVKDITAGPASSIPGSVAWQAAGLYFFTLTDPAGVELWRSDGTAAGTFMVKDISPGTANSLASELVDMGTYAFFRASDGIAGVELWRTDGTGAGTFMVKDINPGAGFSSPTQITRVGNSVFFSAEDVAFNRELWTSDGTAAGTVRVADIHSQGTGSSGGGLGVVGGRFVFVADDGLVGPELWVTDGTSAGTTLLKDINPGAAAPNVNTGGAQATKVNGSLMFGASDGANGAELWRSDGTAAGTFMVRDINPGAASSNVRSFGVLNGELYFTATEAATGTELWKSDGTAVGTQLVRDIVPGPGSSNAGTNNAAPLPRAGNKLIFTATDASGLALWATDGTAAGTTSILPLGTGFPPSLIGSAGPYAIFTRLGPIPPSGTAQTIEYWRTDGSGPGTQLVRTFVSEGAAIGGSVEYNGIAYFQASDGVLGNELWRTDGTSAGTQLVKDIRPGAASSRLTNPRVGAGLLWFSATNGVHGREMWRSDGTEAGTFMVADANPGPLGSFTAFLGELDGLVYFAAFDPVNAWQVWESDGTVAGTMRVTNVPGRLAFIAGASFDNALPEGLVLGINDGVRGAEPWFFTAAADTAPDPFGFPTANNALPGVAITSASVTPAGYSAPAAVGVLNGEYSVGCTGSFTSAPGTLAPGQSICVRHVAAANLSSGVTTTLDVGGTMATFTSLTLAPSPSGAAEGDVNGDGRADLVWVDGAGNVLVGLMDGGASGYTVGFTLPPNTTVAEVADFNGDGRGDLLLVDTVTGAVSVAFFQGTGFASPIAMGGTEGLELVGAARVSGGIGADIVWREKAGARLVLWTVEGGVPVAQEKVVVLGNGWTVLALGDVDGDGSAEAIIMNTGGTLRIMRLAGASAGTEVQLATKAPEARLVGFGDIDGNGRADGVWQSADGALTAWLMNGIGEPTVAAIATLPAGATALELLDLTGDGRADLVVRLADGSLQLWRLSGASVAGIAPMPVPPGGWMLATP